MGTTITRKTLEVPSGIMLTVADIISANEIPHEITGASEDEDTITIELQYEKEDRGFIREMENAIADYEDDEQQDDDDEEDDE